MRPATLVRKLNRIASVYRDAGVAGISSRLLRRLRRLAGRDDPQHARWLQQKQAADAAFDAANGTQTGGIQEIFALDVVGENSRHGLSHIASDPGEFARMIAELDIDPRAATFIDLGSGKGRALLLASAFPFRRIIGVEFAREFHETADANIRAASAGASADLRRIELVCGDAATYALPMEPLVIYLFNPFGSAVVRLCAENAIASWRRAPRPVSVLYMNAIHLADFVEAGWKLRDRKGGYAHLVPCDTVDEAEAV